MSAETDLHPVASLRVGDDVDLADAEGLLLRYALVAENAVSRMSLLLAEPLDDLTEGIFQLCWTDPEGTVWHADCLGFVGDDPLALDLELSDGWYHGEGRWAPRFAAERRPLRAMLAGQPGTCELHALDVSSTGCCVAGAGEPLAVGAELEMVVTAGSYTLPTRLHAVVVRVYLAAFGRFELGLRFTPVSVAEQRLVLRWRDEVAVSGADVPLRMLAA